MDEKQKKELEAKQAEEAKKKAEEDAKKAAEQAEIEAAAAKDAARDEEIKKLTEDRDNYKAVALKRLGKLPADSEFLKDGELENLVADKVKEILVDKEIQAKQREKEEERTKLIRENAELKLALKNRPGSALGGGNGDSLEVKDNVFSEAQLAELRKKAISLKADPEKFIQRAKENFLARR